MLEQIANFVEKLRIASEMQVEQDDDSILISIRDTKDDEPSPQALTDARFVRQKIRDEFHEAISLVADCDDEWVNITIRLL